MYAGTGSGTALVWSDYRESSHVFDVAGTHSLALPAWAKWAQVVVLGGGGGGSGGDSALNRAGNGGDAGKWNSVQMALSGGTMSITVGAGGIRGEKDGVGTAGGASSVSVGSLGVSAGGGAAGPHASVNGNDLGQSPGSYSAFGRTFVGGATAGLDTVGFPPGGGGGRGSGGFFGGGGPGRAGARGQVWVYLYSSL